MVNKLTTKTGIPTADYALNPVRGCANYKCHLHPKNQGGCWAARECRLHAIPWSQYEMMYIDELSNHYYKLHHFEMCWFQSQFDKELPKKPCKIAVGWQSDFAFWPDDWTQKIIDKCRKHPHIHFQWLTKEPEAYGRFKWPKNCWLGFTATNQNEFDSRLLAMLPFSECNFKNSYITYAYLEPLLEKVYLPDWKNEPAKLSWIVAGGQSGPGAKPMHPNWVRSIRDWCIENDVSFFFKQHGTWLHESQIDIESDLYESLYGFGGPKLIYEKFKKDEFGFWKLGKKSGNVLDGRKWEQFPEVRND